LEALKFVGIALHVHIVIESGYTQVTNLIADYSELNVIFTVGVQSAVDILGFNDRNQKPIAVREPKPF